jgi:8-hydroxy-5-deazaflavin:NADPH oxidoreductase
MQVGIVGGTGPAGKALAARLASVGVEVTVGSRQAERGREIAAEITDRWPGLSLPLTGGSNEEAAGAELCVLATPWDAAVSTATGLSAELSGKVVVSMANALQRVGDEFQALVPARGSIATSLQCALPGARVSGAFHHLPARHLAAVDRPIEADVLVCADDQDAITATIALVEAIPGLRGVDAGSLSACGAIEAFTAVILGVNMRHKALASITLTGLHDRGAT